MQKDENNLQHTQVPNEMGHANLDPKDQYIYVIIKSYQNAQTQKCFPSLQEIASKAKTSIPTIRESIKRLVDANYISIERIGRKNYYSFSEYKKFEPISPDFISNPNLSFTTKSYLVATQQYMYKDIENLGKLSISNVNLSKEINMPESTIRKCNAELVSKDYLTILKNENRDLQTGCKTETKLFELNKLGQAIIWALCDHEDRIQQNTNDINALRNEFHEKFDKQADIIDKQAKLIDKLMNENTELKKQQAKTDINYKF